MLPYFPFDFDEYDMPMNARALVGDCLIEIDSEHYHGELSLKHQILAGDHRYYCQALPNSEALQWEAIELLLPNMVRHHPRHFALEIDGPMWSFSNRLLGTCTRFSFGCSADLPIPDEVPSSVAPLDWLGRQVQEDLIVMDGNLSGNPLVAGQLCFPGSWCLDDKMGKSFLAIHHEVPQFARRIGRTAQLMMERLKPGRPTGRVNWTIVSTDRLNCAPVTQREWLHTRRGITPRNAGDRCYLRLERQTLSRLPRTNAILFTIHTYLSPVAEEIGEPERLRRFTSVVKGIPRVTIEYKGMSEFADALIAYLEDRGRDLAGQQLTTAARLLDADAAELQTTQAHIPTRAGWAEEAATGPFYSRSETGEWEPWPLNSAQLLDGDPRPRVHWLRRNGPEEPIYRTGELEMQPARFHWIFVANETFHLLNGRVTIDTDEGVQIELRAGDSASFRASTHAIWSVTEPCRAFFVSTM